MLAVFVALAASVPAAGVTLTLATDAPCVNGASLVKQLDALGVQVVTRQAVLDVDITRTGQSLRLRARRRGDEQLLLRTVPAQPTDCAAAERVVALLIRSWADSAHLPMVDHPDAGVATASAAPNPSPEVLANPLVGIDLPKPKPPGPDETPPIPPRPPEPLHKPAPRPQPSALRVVVVEAPPPQTPPSPEGPPGPMPRRMVFPSGTDESTTNTAQAMIEARAPKPVTGRAIPDEEPPPDGGVEEPPPELAQAEAPIEPPATEVLGTDPALTQEAPQPKPPSPWVARVALMLGGAFGVAPGASPSGEWVAGLSRGRLAAWIDLGFTIGPQEQTSAGQLDLHREWLSLTFGAVFHPTGTLELGAGLGVRGFRLAVVYDRNETDLLALGGVAQGYLSVVLAGPFSVWLRGFFTLRAPADRFSVEGKGTILSFEPWDAGLEAGVGLRFE
ncbi:MAG: hypothetical protein QM723_38225 [Myxococcaceae bacterium]